MRDFFHFDSNPQEIVFLVLVPKVHRHFNETDLSSNNFLENGLLFEHRVNADVSVMQLQLQNNIFYVFSIISLSTIAYRKFLFTKT